MMESPVEIERKWMVQGWPMVDQEQTSGTAAEFGTPLRVLREEIMRQGYISVEPTVRIRSEQIVGEEPEYILCVKSKGNGLSRKETEFPIAKEHFEQLEDIIGYPLVPKVRRTYLLPDGHQLEVNAVDEGSPTAFYYAEIEFPTEEEAKAFEPQMAGLGYFLQNEVTGTPGMSMGGYWSKVRLGMDTGWRQ